MTRLDGRRGGAAALLALALLCWVATSGSSGARQVVRTPTPGAAAIESFSTTLVTTSDRRERALHTELGGDEGAQWGAVIESVRVVLTPALARSGARPSPSILSAGAVPLAFAGRGPPSSTTT